MTKLSSGDKYVSIGDNSQENLLDLDGARMEVGGGFWVKIDARRVAPTPGRPAGIGYSLCLFGPSDERLVCYDNAHPIRVGAGPGAKRTVLHDHVHKGKRIRPYAYKNAGELVADFWNDVGRILKERGVP
ncbi:MAG: hypothetical protein ACT4N4_09575 [Rhodospirillales bacterium]